MIKTYDLISALKFAVVAVGKDVTRKYLCAVELRFTAPEGLAITATDGHRLHTVDLPNVDHGIDGEAVFVAQSADVETLLRTVKTGKRDKSLTVFAYTPEMLHITPEGGQSFYLHPIDGRYPDWHQVIPSGNPVATDVWGIDPRYMAASMTAFDRLAPVHWDVKVTMHGPEAPILIEPGIDLAKAPIRPRAIIMPVRLAHA